MENKELRAKLDSPEMVELLITSMDMAVCENNEGFWPSLPIDVTETMAKAAIRTIKRELGL